MKKIVRKIFTSVFALTFFAIALMQVFNSHHFAMTASMNNHTGIMMSVDAHEASLEIIESSKATHHHGHQLPIENNCFDYCLELAGKPLILSSGNHLKTNTKYTLVSYDKLDGLTQRLSYKSNLGASTVHMPFKSPVGLSSSFTQSHTVLRI